MENDITVSTIAYHRSQTEESYVGNHRPEWKFVTLLLREISTRDAVDSNNTSTWTAGIQSNGSNHGCGTPDSSKTKATGSHVRACELFGTVQWDWIILVGFVYRFSVRLKHAALLDSFPTIIYWNLSTMFPCSALYQMAYLKRGWGSSSMQTYRNGPDWFYHRNNPKPHIIIGS